MKNTKRGDQSNATGTDAGYGHYDQYEGDSELHSKRTQFHSSYSQPSMNNDRRFANDGTNFKSVEFFITYVLLFLLDIFSVI